tara:strand:+ start:1930 stop:2439 length:510 start_codon:yes stop_codon:yes gene_type:complete
MYFNSFPLILYDMKGDDKQKLAVNIIKRVKVRSKIVDTASLFQKYFVNPGERPEDVANKHFGKSEYHWIILLTNNITDAYYQWPMSYTDFENFIKDKYEIPGAIHHYEKKQTSGDTGIHIECASTDSGAVAVSNREYEQRLQDEMSEIKLMSNDYLTIFLDEFDKLMSE